MTIHILVEGPSERILLEQWAKRVLKDVAFRVHPHQGKGALPRGKHVDARPDPKQRGLLDQLPANLRAFSASFKPDDAVLVLVDADTEDPHDLRLAIAELIAKHPSLRGAVALAVEETEAFYLGDLAALERAYPDADLELARQYEPDSVCGTWEFFGRVVHDDGENKTAWAKAMGVVLTTVPARSRSPSFRLLIGELKKLQPALPASVKRRPYHHPIAPKKDGSGRHRNRSSGGR